MAHLMIHHQVVNFDAWKPVFDAFEPNRHAMGGGPYKLFRSVDDSNEVVVVMEWDDIENARAFAQSEDLRAAMQEAGVLGPPTIVFMEQE